MSKRLFTGFKVDPEPMQYFFEVLQAELKGERIKWVEPWNLHVTLWFFGDTEERDIPGILRELGKAAQDQPAFEVIIRSCGTFGPPHKPTIIWAGLQLPQALVNLAAQIKGGVQSLGLSAMDKDFRPHLTLGRIKNLKDSVRLNSLLESMKDEEFQTCFVNSFSLFESRLSPQGPVYNELEIFTLEG